MKEEFIATGKNVDTAIANGLLEIGKAREDVDIKILETGGLFKKAKVVLIYEKEEILPASEDKKEIAIEEKKSVQNVDELKEVIKEIAEETKLDIDVNIEVVNENEVIHNLEESDDNKQEVANIASEKVEKEVVDVDKLVEKVKTFLNGIIEKYNLQANIVSEVKNKEVYFNITGENVGKLIGYRGDNLNAIQYLMGCLKEGAENRYRLYLDVENYKAKREQTLVELANKMADKAEDIERNVHLDPMNAYERRIIHTTLQDREKVETESMGEGEKRHVVIKFKR